MSKVKKTSRDFGEVDQEGETRTKKSYLMASTLRRLGGAGAVLGGAVLSMWGYLHGNIVLSSGTVLTVAMGLLINTLLLIGLGGLCAWWWQGPTSWLGAAGFVLCFAGAALSVAHGIYAFITTNGIAELAPWYVYVREATGLPTVVFRWLPMLPIGLAAVGTSAIRAGALGGWGILPLAMGLSGGAYHLTDSDGVMEMGAAHASFGVVYSLSWVFLGWLLWTRSTAVKDHPLQR